MTRIGIFLYTSILTAGLTPPVLHFMWNTGIHSVLRLNSHYHRPIHSNKFVRWLTDLNLSNCIIW